MDKQQSTEVSAAENGRESEDHKEEGSEKGLQFHPLTQAGSGSFPGFYGKHRLQAALSHLNNQINILQVNALICFATPDELISYPLFILISKLVLFCLINLHKYLLLHLPFFFFLFTLNRMCN